MKILPLVKNDVHWYLFVHSTSMALLFQAILALFRCSPESSYRPVFNWLHWFFGTVGYVLSSKLLGSANRCWCPLFSLLFTRLCCSVFWFAICYTQSNKLPSNELLGWSARGLFLFSCFMTCICKFRHGREEGRGIVCTQFLLISFYDSDDFCLVFFCAGKLWIFLHFSV